MYNEKTKINTQNYRNKIKLNPEKYEHLKEQQRNYTNKYLDNLKENGDYDKIKNREIGRAHV